MDPELRYVIGQLKRILSIHTDEWIECVAFHALFWTVRSIKKGLIIARLDEQKGEYEPALSEGLSRVVPGEMPAEFSKYLNVADTADVVVREDIVDWLKREMGLGLSSQVYEEAYALLYWMKECHDQECKVIALNEGSGEYLVFELNV